ncbi:hypothetical protein HELRODRAFT_80522, partial [Helobdella robusta]|uniref:COMM domain-containing protein n=1 Tax=Helobdella robusta TaxID=6412 RepID=T1G418_HELRO
IQKFKFCGDLDCPDWVLAEISTLSKLAINFSIFPQSSIKVKLLCTQVFKNLLSEDVDQEKIAKLGSDAKFKLNDVKASLAVITLILSNATKFAVNSSSLSNELQQLGMPKEHATVLCKFYEDNVNSLREEFHRNSFKLIQLESVGWRVDHLIASNELSNLNEPIVRLNIKTRDPDANQSETTFVTLTSDKLLLLLDGWAMTFCSYFKIIDLKYL